MDIAESASVVALQDVSKRYGTVDAVDRVSFAVAPGEFFSILGPSGCGKTTTLRLIAGFETPSDGRVLLEGADVAGVPPYHRHVNTVFQHYALFPHMSVFDNVAFGPRSARFPERATRVLVREALAVVRLESMAGRKPDQLSGGEQQRVALARAFVNRPAALLLDEPLGALDVELRDAMQLELRRIQRSIGIAFVYVTHDQQEALRLSDRLAVMRAGRVEQIGTPEEVYRRPATAFVAGFLGSANVLRGRVVAIDEAGLLIDVVGARVLASGSAAPGSDVHVVVRPGDVSIVPLGRGVLDGCVTDSLFEGSASRLVVATAAGDVQALVSSGATVGEAVAVAWDPASAYVLPVRD